MSVRGHGRTGTQVLLVSLLFFAHVLPVVLAAGTAAALAATSVKVRVLDEEGRPVRNAVVQLKAEGGSQARSATTDERGEATLSAEGGVAWSLMVSAEGFLAHRQRLSLDGARRKIVVELKKNHFAQQITVTAHKPARMAEKRLPASALVKAGHEDIGEALRQVPGLEVFRRGSINMDPTIRGLQEAEVATMVDGTRTFAAGPGGMDSGLSSLGPHSLSEVRIVKGPYALAWGAGAMSAIDLITYRPAFTEGGFHAEGRAGASYGTNGDTSDLFGSWGGATDRIRFHVDTGYRGGTDYKAGDGSEIPGDYGSTDLGWGVGYRPTRRVLIEYTGGYQDQEKVDYPGRLLDATYFRSRTSSVETTWERDGLLSEVYGKAWLSFKDHAMNNDAKPTAQPDPGRIPPFGIAVDLPTRSHMVGGRTYAVLSAGTWRTQLGGDIYSLSQDASRTISRRDTGTILFEDVVWPDALLRDLGVYAETSRESGRLRFGGTARTDFVAASAGATSTFFRTNTSDSLHQRETNFSAAVSARYRLGRSLVLSGGAGQVVRTASALERYSDRFPTTKAQVSAEFVGDPGIGPEKCLQADFGISGGQNGLAFDVDGFYRIIDNYITLQEDPKLFPRLPLSPTTVYRYVNGERAEYWGGEASIRQRVGAMLSWHASTSYVWAKDTALGEPVFGIPPLHGEAAIRGTFQGAKGLWLELEAMAWDRQSRVAVSRGEMESPGYTVWNLRGGVDLAKGLSLQGGVLNLGDKSYADHLNAVNPFTGERVPEMGLTVYAGIDYTF